MDYQGWLWDAFLVNQIEKLFADDKFDLKDVTFENFTRNGDSPTASLCGAFGPGMSASAYVDETFAKLAARGMLGGLEIDNKTFKVELRGELSHCRRGPVSNGWARTVGNCATAVQYWPIQAPYFSDDDT